MDDLDWIKRGLQKPGKTQRGLAKAIGIDPTGVNRLLKGERTLKAKEVAVIRRYLEMDDDANFVDKTREQVAPPNHIGLPFSPGARTHETWPKDVKIIGHVRAGIEGFFLDQGEVHGMAYRPPALSAVKDAFAVYVQDESMVPAFRPGRIAWVHPTRPPSPGDDVIVELADGQAFIKTLVRRTATKVICQQWQPKKEIVYEADKVKRLYYVVGSYKED